MPALGDRRVRGVVPPDVADVIRTNRDGIAKTARARTGGRPAARALLAACKGLFSYAVAIGVAASSPAAQITGAVFGAPPRKPYLCPVR